VTSLLLEHPDLVGRSAASITDDVTRRGLIAGAGAAAFLVACGRTNGGDAPAGGAAGAGFPLSIDGAFGPTAIDRRPERVVAVGFLRDGDDAVALGITPVAMATSGNFEGLAPWTVQALGGADPVILEVTDDLPFEQIAAARPDLILATDDRALPDHHARLAAIAPTLSYVTGAEADPWRLRAERIGRALGRSEQATEVTRRIEQRIASIREQHPGFEGATIVTGVAVGGTLYTVNRESDAGAALLLELGFRLPPQMTTLPETFPGRAVISPEQVSLLEADVIAIYHVTPDDRAMVESNELFQRLEAVRRGSYVALDGPDAISRAYPSLLGIPYALDRMVPQFSSALAA